MSSINSVQQIVATIRTEMASRVKTAGARAAGVAGKRGARTKATPQVQSRMGSLISQRVKALDPDDPKRGRKAFRIFLESVLLNELGEELINDHSFYLMVDQVQEAMEQDKQIADAIQTAVASLLENPAAAQS
jgi:hypothetical protein